MWNQNDFCDRDSGFDYIFTKMNAIYGSVFEYQWMNIEPEIVRATWIELCANGLTYRPKMDYALSHLNPDKPPSALAFARLLREGPPIPTKTQVIEKQKTQAEIAEEKKQSLLAKKKIREMLKNVKLH
jgi:hypothetical protein